MRTLLLGCCVACAHALSSASATAADDPPAPAFIERTHVVAPHRVGDFVLEATRYDAGNRLAGVMLRYLVPGRDETRIDLFVYPHGQSGAEEALDKGMADFHASLEAAVQAGYFRGLVAADAGEFDVALPAASTAVSPSVPHPDADHDPGLEDPPGSLPVQDDSREALLASLLARAPRHVDGRAIELGYDAPGAGENDWFAMRSRGYLLYRQLHFFKGRISAAESRIGRDEFTALADRAMRELVPAVQAYNVGGCGDTTIHVDSDLEEQALGEALMRQLVAAEIGSAARNCHRTLDEEALAALAQDAEIVTIDYAPEDWGGH